jgi:hypothetical protein
MSVASFRSVYISTPHNSFSPPQLSLSFQQTSYSLVTSHFFTMARTWTWLRALNVGAALLMAILFMGMVANANAEETEAKDNGITGPGQSKDILASSLLCAIH